MIIQEKKTEQDYTILQSTNLAPVQWSIIVRGFWWLPDRPSTGLTAAVLASCLICSELEFVYSHVPDRHATDSRPFRLLQRSKWPDKSITYSLLYQHCCGVGLPVCLRLEKELRRSIISAGSSQSVIQNCHSPHHMRMRNHYQPWCGYKLLLGSLGLLLLVAAAGC